MVIKTQLCPTFYKLLKQSLDDAGRTTYGQWGTMSAPVSLMCCVGMSDVGPGPSTQTEPYGILIHSQTHIHPPWSFRFAIFHSELVKKQKRERLLDRTRMVEQVANLLYSLAVCEHECLCDSCQLAHMHLCHASVKQCELPSIFAHYPQVSLQATV